MANQTVTTVGADRRPTTLSRLLNGDSKRHTCGGYGWKYVEA